MSSQWTWLVYVLSLKHGREFCQSWRELDGARGRRVMCWEGDMSCVCEGEIIGRVLTIGPPILANSQPIPRDWKIFSNTRVKYFHADTGMWSIRVCCRIINESLTDISCWFSLVSMKELVVVILIFKKDYLKIFSSALLSRNNCQIMVFFITNLFPSTTYNSY